MCLGQAVNSFDTAIISFFNHFAHRSWAFDTFLYLLDFNSLLKTTPILTVLWWAWFREDEKRVLHRELLLSGIIASFPAIAFARLVSVMAPFRERPMRSLSFHFQLPYNMKPEHLMGWSSFPSDNATLVFTVAASLLFASRRAGVFSLCYSFITVGLARIYLGIHYPTDILVGAFIGIATAAVFRVPAVRIPVTRPAMRWLNMAPGSFYACFFLITYLIADSFNSLIEAYNFSSAMAKAIRNLL